MGIPYQVSLICLGHVIVQIAANNFVYASMPYNIRRDLESDSVCPIRY
jgi:hypothetical protein